LFQRVENVTIERGWFCIKVFLKSDLELFWAKPDLFKNNLSVSLERYLRKVSTRRGVTTVSDREGTIEVTRETSESGASMASYRKLNPIMAVCAVLAIAFQASA